MKNRHAYFDLVERDGFALADFGAACDRALPAAIFDLTLVLLLRNTDDAAFAAFALVFL